MSSIATRRLSARPTASEASTTRAVIYLRVSTGRQAEHDLSIPDQRRQIEAWAAARGYSIAEEYVEPGATATDDRRPEFQRMVDRACDGSNSIDVIIVHSFSRFMRDSFMFEMYVRRLGKHGVKVFSITQEVNEDDPAQAMMRKVIALFDEYQSKENAKHVLRSMKENARQGFWNGSIAPLGYKVVEAERRGARAKKKLAIDPVEAETVRLIFRLFVEGDSGSGPLGVKGITCWLNEHGHRTRNGGLWGLSRVHALLTNPVYAGRLRFNRKDSKTHRIKAETEFVYCDAPAIIAANVFDGVQKRLAARNPKVAPPRVVSGPILLTGLAACATCGGAMTLRAGTSRSGQVYRYYSCASAMKKGKLACKGRSIPMDKLDALVTEQLSEHLLQPGRLTSTLTALAGRRADRQAALDNRIAALTSEAELADNKLRRLYELVENGLAKLDAVLKDRIEVLQTSRDIALAALERAKSATRPTEDISAAAVDRFARAMRERLSSGQVPFRKAYIRSIVDRIEVDDRCIRIMGRKDVLEQAVLAEGGTAPPVHTFVPSWRARLGSNQRPSD